MKKLLPFTISLLFFTAISSYAQSGTNCFNTQFDNSAPSLNTKNAFLLGYLCTMSYADYLRYLYSPVQATTSSFITSIRNDDDEFKDEFGQKLRYLFTNSPTLTAAASTSGKLSVNPDLAVNKSLSPAVGAEPAVTFDFIHKCNPSGYDPEALFISTPTTIFVVFRGTDRVACNVTSSGYTWAEWMASDFKFFKRDASMMHPQVKGQVHRGMVESLMSQNFANELGALVYSSVKNKTTNATKKVWITGHSLGGAHAQLFAMYLKYNYNITAQGLYIYEAPHPGDATFVSQLNNDIGKSRIQRFEFGDDPIPTLPPQAFLFARAGERNYFKDYSSTNLRSEQTLADDARILCALGNLPGEQIPQAAKLEFPPYCPGSTCYHHPTFILEAIRHQLSASVLPSLPPSVSLPVAGDNCNKGDLTKAENNDLINNTATAVENTIANIAWAAGNILDNLLGSGIAEGNYKLSCYAFKNSSKKYLNWNGTTNSQVRIDNSGTVFTLKHKGTGGYQLFKSSGNLAADVKFSFGLPTGEEQTNNIIMKAKDDIIGDEETWYFFKIANTTNTFVLLNWNTQRVLEAPVGCLTGGGCAVDESAAKSNQATQVWILEKVN